MTRELRQANWVFFTSSQVVDADVMVRVTAGSRAVARHVRYDCNTGACYRYEGPAVAFPPPPTAAFNRTSLVLGSRIDDPHSFAGRVIGHDVFYPKRVDPSTGASTADYLDPDLLYVRLRIAVNGLEKPLELADGISLRNRTRFGS